MFINFWYVAEESEAIKAEPQHIRMLGLDFVLFRDAAGQVYCLSDVCSHRGASLSKGKMKEDCLECPYHGWRFDGAGACIRIPSLSTDAPIPARAKVDAYPVEERYGLIFVFLGDLPEEERPPILEIPEWHDADWRCTRQRFDARANIQRSFENTLDPAHTEFVHPSMGYQGDRDDYAVPELKLVDTDWGTGTMTTFQSPDLPDQRMKGVKGEGQMEAGSGSHGASAAWTYLHFTPTMQAHQYGFKTPVDEYETRTWVVQARNFRTGPEFDAVFLERNNAVADQDRVVIERLAPALTPQTNSKEVIVPADQVIVRYREFLKNWESKGWRIDVDAMRAGRDRIAYAIPSPARRTSKSWVIDTVPMMPGSEEGPSELAAE